MFQNVIYALIATTGTWLITLLGAGTTIFFKSNNKIHIKTILGFSAGIMIASSIWSLIVPALELTNGIIVIICISIGTFVLYCTELTITKIRNFSQIINKKNKNLIMMILSITLHNIPEGLAIGISFGSVGKQDKDGILAAIILAVGIGLQNFPEGAAVSLPLMSAGVSKRKSFLIGQASAIVEPIFGIIGALAVTLTKMIIPYCLAFAAGCMMFVVIDDLIPQATNDNNNIVSSLSFMAGFCLMMLLDVML